MSLRELLAIFPPDRCVPFTAKRVDVARNEYELPTHQHAVGQLVLTLWGSTACRVFGNLWLVPPQCAVWIPPNTPHCNRITARSSVCLLFIQQESVQLPSTCCTLAITPLVRELILHVAALAPDAISTDHAEHLIQVLLTELSRMPVTGVRLPVSSDARLQSVAESIIGTSERPFRLGQIYRHEPPFPSTACSQGDRIIFWTLATATSSGYSYPKIVRRRQRATDSMGSWLRIRYGLYYDVQKGAGNLTGEICHGRCRGKVA